jgi:hypothetical protein
MGLWAWVSSVARAAVAAGGHRRGQHQGDGHPVRWARSATTAATHRRGGGDAVTNISQGDRPVALGAIGYTR